MIRPIFDIIISELNAYVGNLVPAVPGQAPHVVPGNIAMSENMGGQNAGMVNKIVLSLVNVMEETTLKNSSPYRPSANALRTEKEQPPVYTNIYLLFTVNFSGGTDGTSYLNNMSQLTRVIEFFQGKQEFSISNSPQANLMTDPQLQELTVCMELVSLTFEQINYLWGSLGGKQLPFVLYKASVIPIRREFISGRGSEIIEIQADSQHLKPTLS